MTFTASLFPVPTQLKRTIPMFTPALVFSYDYLCLPLFTRIYLSLFMFTYVYSCFFNYV